MPPSSKRAKTRHHTMDNSVASPARVAEKRADPESKTESMDGPLAESSTELTAPGESVIEDLVETLCRYRRANLQFPAMSKHDIAMTERSLRLFASAVSPELYTQSTLGYSYKQLDDGIRHLTAKFFESTSWTNLTPAEQEMLRSWTPKAKQYIESTTAKRLIFHAWIWHILDEKIFSADLLTKWDAEDENRMDGWKLLGRSMNIFQKFDGDMTRNRSIKYHLWRALGADLSRAYAHMPGTVAQGYAGELIKKELGHLMRQSGLLDDFLESVSESAADFDFQLMSNRAKVSLMWHDPQMPEPKRCFGFPFKRLSEGEYGERMVGRDLRSCSLWDPPVDGEGKPVELVVAPGLVSNGKDMFRYAVVDWETRRWRWPMVATVDLFPDETGPCETTEATAGATSKVEAAAGATETTEAAARTTDTTDAAAGATSKV